MKKLIYILMFVFTIVATNKTFAQAENPDQSLKSVVKETLFQKDCGECLAQQQDIISILNYYNQKFKWGYETFRIGNIGGVVDQSHVVFGSSLKGRISVHSIQDDGTVDATEKIFPKPMDRFLAFNGLPFVQIKTRRKIEVVKFDKNELPPKEVAEVLPTKEREEKPQKNVVATNNDDQYEYTDQKNGNGDIIVEVHCDHKEKARVQENNEVKYSYKNVEYAYRENSWVVYNTGMLVGGGMCALLNNIFFRPNQNSQYQQYQQQYQPYQQSYQQCGGRVQPAPIYGSNIPGWH